jgi:predicted branched-subunit amino acid permease
MSIGKGSLVSVSVSVGLATGLYGISFGALSVTAGFDIWQTMALSLLMFSGGSQFAFVATFAVGGVGALPAAITSAWLLGVRNGFYALTLAPKLGISGIMKVLGAQLTIDESTAVSTSRQNETEQKRGFWLTGIAVFVFWNLATVLGAILGNLISDPADYGLDAAAAAALFALVWPRLQTVVGATVGAVALTSSVLLSLVLPTGIPVLAGSGIAVLAGLLVARREA